MTEDKIRKIIISSTVGAILLLILLLLVMVYQLIAIRVERNRKVELEQKIAEYEALIEDGEETYEARSLRAWIEMRARELGYVFDTDIGL